MDSVRTEHWYLPSSRWFTEDSVRDRFPSVSPSEDRDVRSLKCSHCFEELCFPPWWKWTTCFPCFHFTVSAEASIGGSRWHGNRTSLLFTAPMALDGQTKSGSVKKKKSDLTNWTCIHSFTNKTQKQPHNVNNLLEFLIFFFSGVKLFHHFVHFHYLIYFLFCEIQCVALLENSHCAYKVFNRMRGMF